jgi:hypothetical protein
MTRTGLLVVSFCWVAVAAGPCLASGQKVDGGSSGAPETENTRRTYRMDRWTLLVPSTTGEEYRQSLSSMKAVVAFPAEQSQHYRVFRDLEAKTSKVEASAELAKLNWIYWAILDENDRGSVRQLGKALGMDDPPRRMYVFIPRELEEEMLKQELAHAQLSEAEIRDQRLETRFSASRCGDKWVFKVIRQGPSKK